MNNINYGLMNIILWLVFVVFIVGIDCDFKVEDENFFVWIVERAILGSYLIVTRVINGLKRTVELVYGGITVIIAWINARFWDEEE